MNKEKKRNIEKEIGQHPPALPPHRGDHRLTSHRRCFCLLLNVPGMGWNVHGSVSPLLSNFPESVLHGLPPKFNFPSRLYYKRGR